MYFLEAKRVYNYLLSRVNIGDDLFKFDYRLLKEIVYLDKDRIPTTYKPQHLTSSILQDQVRLMQESVKGLVALRKKGHKIGGLKYKSECNSIRFLQYGLTHKIKGSKIKLQGIRDAIRVNGLKQLSKYQNIDYTVAYLLYDGVDYFIRLTCFVDKEKKQYKPESIGIDMGVATHLALSDGRKINVTVEESERLKNLQRALALKQKRSNNWYKLRTKIRKEYNHMSNIKNDRANKIAHELLQYERVILQDEQIVEWNKKTIQHSILGRLKMKLKGENVYILDQYFPTTQYCNKCGSFTKHDPSKRTYKCPVCGLPSDRDIHAAQNMILMLDKVLSAGTVDIKPCKKIRFNSVESIFEKRKPSTSLV